MTLQMLIVRETLISIVINSAISIGVFMLVFGLERPVPSQTLGWDFLPQSFMIALMGSLVPALLLRRRFGARVGAIMSWSVAIAIVAALLPGGIAAIVTPMLANGVIAANTALLIKASYGATLAAVVTPIALVAISRQSGHQI
jgi:hypothetical protein